MSVSSVSFRINQGNLSELITFNGNGIKLLDLKKEIYEKKKFHGSVDFDLKIVDENGKVYKDDDEIVPKNSSLVVKRVPANSKTSLITKLNNLGHFKKNAIVNQGPKDINMPMKEEEIGFTEELVEIPIEDEVITLVRHDESAVKSGAEGFSQSAVTAGVTGRAPVGAGEGRGIPRPPVTYVCSRCSKPGHYVKFCPTNGDPAFDPEMKLMNIPKNSRRKVTNLDGVDVTNKTVIPQKDGTYEIFESTLSGREKLSRESESQLSAIDMTEVPEHLKCALSGNFLREAVTLPCCKKCVNDTIVRQELISSALRCPLCGSTNVSPDSLIIRKDVRDNVEAFIKNKGKAANPTESPVINGMDGGPTAVTSPLINKPPPPMLPPPMGVGQYPPVKGAPVVPMYSAPPGYKPASMMLAPANIGYDAPNMWRPSNGVFELPPVEFFPLPLTEEEFYIEKELQWKEYKANRDLSRKNFHGRGAGYRGEYRGRSPQERFREQDFPNKRNHDGAAGRFARDREGANHRNDNFNYRSSSAKRSFSRERRGRSAEKNFDKNEHSKYNDAATDSRGSKSNSLVDRRDSRHRSRSPHGSKQSDSRARHNRGDSRSRAEKVRSSRDRSSRDKSYNLNDRKSEKNDRSFNHDSSRHDDRSSSIFSKKDSKRTDDRKDRKQDRRDTDDTDHNHKKRKTETADDKYTEASSQKSSSRASDRPGKVELVKNKIDDRDERDYRASKTTDNSRENQDDRKTSHRSGRLDEDRSQRESGHREKSHKDKSHRDKDRHSSRSEHSKDKDSKSRSKRSGHNSSKTEAKIILQDPDLNQPLKSHRSNDSSKHDKKKRRH